MVKDTQGLPRFTEKEKEGLFAVLEFIQGIKSPVIRCGFRAKCLFCGEKVHMKHKMGNYRGRVRHTKDCIWRKLGKLNGQSHRLITDIEANTHADDF